MPGYKAAISYIEHVETDKIILTKHRMAKMKSGMVERPSSQRQPRVGITRMAKRTSNTVPSAQNIYKTKSQLYKTLLAKKKKKKSWVKECRTVHTSISRMHVALDFIGRNSAYSVTLIRRDISQLILTQIITYSSVRTTIVKKNKKQLDFHLQ